MNGTENVISDVPENTRNLFLPMPLTDLFSCHQWCQNDVLSAMISILEIRKSHGGSDLGGGKAGTEQSFDFWHRTFVSNRCRRRLFLHECCVIVGLFNEL